MKKIIILSIFALIIIVAVIASKPAINALAEAITSTPASTATATPICPEGTPIPKQIIDIGWANTCGHCITPEPTKEGGHIPDVPIPTLPKPTKEVGHTTPWPTSTSTPSTAYYWSVDVSTNPAYYAEFFTCSSSTTVNLPPLDIPAGNTFVGFVWQRISNAYETKWQPEFMSGSGFNKTGIICLGTCTSSGYTPNWNLTAYWVGNRVGPTTRSWNYTITHRWGDPSPCYTKIQIMSIVYQGFKPIPPTPTPTPFYPNLDCVNWQYADDPEVFIDDPVVTWDGLTITQGDCYTVIPGVDFTIDIVEAITGSPLHVLLPEVQVCTKLVQFPEIKLFDFTIPLEIIFTFPFIAMVMRWIARL